MIDVVYGFMLPMSMVAISAITLIAVFRTMKKTKNGHYSIPDWNYGLKKWWAQRQIRKHKQQNPLKRDYSKEAPKILRNEDSSDSQYFYGNDQNGNSLTIKITRLRHRVAEVWLILRFNGRTFVLPDHPDTHITSATPRKFEAGGLRMQCLHPFNRWRIVYNGMLREISSLSEDDQYAEEDMKFIKFNFFWNAVGDPLYMVHDWSDEIMASAVSLEPWRDEFYAHKLFVTDAGGYDQFGVLFGQVHWDKNDDNKTNDIPDMDSCEFNLPGIRQRRWGPNKSSHLHRTVSIVVATDEGNIVTLTANSFMKGITHSVFGYIRNSSTKIRPITETDFHMVELAENSNNIPNALSIRFKAGGKSYCLVINFMKMNKVQLIGGRPFSWTVNLVPIDVGFNGERGRGLVSMWYPVCKKKPSFFVPEDVLLPSLRYNTEPINNEISFCYPFSDERCRSVKIAGGKGASLALLNQSMTIISETGYDEYDFPKFQVPCGFVIGSSAFGEYLSGKPDLVELIERLQRIAYGLDDGDLQEICQSTSEAIARSILPNEIETDIRLAFDNLEQEVEIESPYAELRFAVRSSALEEDGEDSSSAGQNETFLGLYTAEDVLEAVKKCWSSLYKFQSVQYRKQHIQPIQTSMSVVVQLMVPSDVSGVLFTQDPIKGDPSQMLITANYGLGESVVSGEVDPDVYKIRKMNGNLKIVDTKIGDKKFAIKMTDDDDFVNKDDLTESERKSECLNNELVFALCKIGINLEKMYGNGRDIEWAVHDGLIYLLQSRPITGLYPMSEWELLHEFDTAIPSVHDLNTFANVGEVFPEIITPLCASTTVWGIDRPMSPLIKGEKETFKSCLNAITITNLRVTLQIYATFFQTVEKEVNAFQKVISLTTFGRNFVTQEIHERAIRRNGITDGKTKGVQFLNLFRMLRGYSKLIKNAEAVLKSSSNQYQKVNIEFFKTPQNLFNDLLHKIQLLDSVVCAHTTTTSVGTFYQLISMVIMLNKNQSELTNEQLNDHGILLGSCSNVESAEVPILLEKIANTIFKSGLGEDFVLVNIYDGEDWLSNTVPLAFQQFEDFIRRHGHRGLREFDIGIDPWDMKRHLVIEVLQSIVSRLITNQAASQPRKELSNQELIDSLTTVNKKSTKLVLRFVLPKIKKLIQEREKTKSLTVAYINELRRGFRQLGVLMHNEGYLPDTHLLPFLTIDEIKQVLTNRDSSLITKAIRRSKLFDEWNKLKYAEIVSGIPEPLNLKAINYEDATGSIKINATPVCGGTVKGRACVLKNFSEVSKIKPGDILITHSTDIGWSPYFPALGGVVTELGGLISHGAVVAREYGIPCVVSAIGATDAFKFGDNVLLNAEKGFILKIDDVN